MAHSPLPMQPRSAERQSTWRQQAPVLVRLGPFSILLSWPLLPNLTDRVNSSGGFDSVHYVRYLWHGQQAVTRPVELFHRALLSAHAWLLESYVLQRTVLDDSYGLMEIFVRKP